MTRILFVRDKTDVVVQSLTKNLDLKTFDISVLDFKHGELISVNKGDTIRLLPFMFSKIRMISYLLRFFAAFIYIIRFSKYHYDVIHVLNIKRENFWLFPFFKRKATKFLLSVYGKSTFLYRTKRLLFTRVLKYPDYVVFTNPSMLREFSLHYKNVETSKMIISYIPVVNVATKRRALNEATLNDFCIKYNIRNDLIRISCSSTISSYDQHEKVIDALAQIKNKHKVQLMFLLTYGGTVKMKQSIIEKIQNTLADCNVAIVDSFLSNEELAAYRSLTDIYVNMRTSDQMAGAVVESLFEGALLLSASWLNYLTLDDIGIHYNKVPDFDRLTSCLDESIEYLPIFKSKYAFSNREKILNEFSLERSIQRWNDIYFGNQLDNN